MLEKAIRGDSRKPSSNGNNGGKRESRSRHIQRDREQIESDSEAKAQQPDGETTTADAEPKPKKRVASLKNAVLAIEELNLADVHYDTFLQRLMTGSPAREWIDADDRINLTHCVDTCRLTTLRLFDSLKRRDGAFPKYADSRNGT